VTGVAGPDRQDGVPVGTVYVGISGPRGGEVRRLTVNGERADVRSAAVAAALALAGEWVTAAG
jgi:nicotinamide-nucleotide amidase